jgi:N-acetylmuramoyl-L-alanine amidase
VKENQRLLSSAPTRRLLLALTTVLLLGALPSAAMAKSMKLYVDPGHGGKDPGAVSGGLAEKDSNLKISRYVKKAAKRQGWKVKMSRNTDKFVSLKARPRKAAKWKADAFVSVHSKSTGKKALGNMTIYRSKSGKKLGKGVMREMKKLTPYEDIGNRRDERGLAVLRQAKTPAVLVEVLSVSTPKERKKLKSPEHQKAAAEAIVKGIAKAKGVKYVPPKKAKAEEPKRKAEPTPVPEPKVETPVEKAPPVEPVTPAENPQADPTAQPAVNKAAVAETDAKAQAAKAASADPIGAAARTVLGSLWRLIAG